MAAAYMILSNLYVPDTTFSKRRHHLAQILVFSIFSLKTLQRYEHCK